MEVFQETLLALNQTATFLALRSLFQKDSILELEKNKFLLSANIIGASLLEPFKRSFIYMMNKHCVTSVHIWSYSGPYFPTLGLETERYYG